MAHPDGTETAHAEALAVWCIGAAQKQLFKTVIDWTRPGHGRSELIVNYPMFGGFVIKKQIQDTMCDPVLPDPGGRFPADEFRFTKKARYRAPVHV